MSTSHKCCCCTIFTNTHSCASDIQTLQGGCPRMFLFLLSDQVKLVNWPADNVWLREVCRARVFQPASFTSTIGVVRKSTDSQPHGHQVRKILDTHTCHLRNRNCLSTTRQCNVSLWLSELTGESVYMCVTFVWQGNLLSHCLKSRKNLHWPSINVELFNLHGAVSTNKSTPTIWELKKKKIGCFTNFLFNHQLQLQTHILKMGSEPNQTCR